MWDNGKVGNYWSDYHSKYHNATEIEASGVGKTPYVLDENNVDHYPLMQQVDISKASPSTSTLVSSQPEPFPIITVTAVSGASIAVIGIGLLVYFKKHTREAELS